MDKNGYSFSGDLSIPADTDLSGNIPGILYICVQKPPETDETLTFKNGVLSVNTASEVEADNTLPVTSAAVNTVVGNVEALLKTI